MRSFYSFAITAFILAAANFATISDVSAVPADSAAVDAEFDRMYGAVDRVNDKVVRAQATADTALGFSNDAVAIAQAAQANRGVDYQTVNRRFLSMPKDRMRLFRSSYINLGLADTDSAAQAMVDSAAALFRANAGRRPNTFELAWFVWTDVQMRISERGGEPSDEEGEEGDETLETRVSNLEETAANLQGDLGTAQRDINQNKKDVSNVYHGLKTTVEILQKFGQTGDRKPIPEACLKVLKGLTADE